jgi:hypothetical protein
MGFARRERERERERERIPTYHHHPSTYVLHYVETLCVVWPILHATMSSSADTAPRSLSKPAHHTHTHTHTMSVGKPTLSNKSVMTQTANAN